MERRNGQNARRVAIAYAIMEEYQLQTREEIQNTIKHVFDLMPRSY